MAELALFLATLALVCFACAFFIDLRYADEIRATNARIRRLTRELHGLTTAVQDVRTGARATGDAALLSLLRQSDPLVDWVARAENRLAIIEACLTDEAAIQGEEPTHDHAAG